ncbi:thiol reductant ABC exporter subunit CydD [Deinococcus cellulosilyticus]|uniref:Thiol reductant ABC exporter subunit CydD n=1 Tax=Deinococcus cellulosilyticus (strain DSM 18568 / NBRC 106333 / KACC 11606 / 5516J-15) TaxID=1223518 RepID=A0A511N957_DEIC1|nr:thiol reductant ABC exporter subunit CydD [Deinococcus cellulosilyticus]GEM49330.1 thiol reductant ABC exporter subunit CydD [Deinococcus cellulosilyticus NBRC 106333 = KACC 11606]
MKPFLTRAGTHQIAVTSALFAVLTTALTLVMWFCAARVLNAVLLELRQDWTLLLWIGVCWALRGTLQVLRDRVVFQQAQRIKTDWRQQLFQSQMQQNTEHHEQQVLGRTLSVLDEGIEQVSKFHERFLPVAASSPVLAGLVLVVMFTQDWVSALLVMVTGPLIILFMVLIGYAAQAYQEEQFSSLGLLSTHFVRTMRNLPIIRAYGWQHKALSELKSANSSLRVKTMQVLRVAFLSGFVLELGATLSTALVAVAIGVRVFEGKMEYLPALYVLLLTPEYFLSLRNLGSEHHAFMEARAVLPEVLRLDQPRKQAPERTEILQRPPEILLRNVSIARGTGMLLQGLNVSVPSGGLLNIAGPSGSGKTTLVSALLGMRDVAEGEILLAGHSVQLIHPDEWKARVAYVSQFPVFVSGTIRDNLQAGRPDATDPEMVESLKRTHLWEALQHRGGLDLPLSEGALNLSAGERARLALSRAFLKDAPLVVLDEPTAHLDPQTEERLIPILKDLMTDKTSVLITHRRALRFPGAKVLALSGETTHA